MGLERVAVGNLPHASWVGSLLHRWLYLGEIPAETEGICSLVMQAHTDKNSHQTFCLRPTSRFGPSRKIVGSSDKNRLRPTRLTSSSGTIWPGVSGVLSDMMGWCGQMLRADRKIQAWDEALKGL